MSKKITHIFNAFSQSAQQHAEKEVVFYKKGEDYLSHTYGTIYQQSIQFSNYLQNHKIKPGDKVAIILDNQPEYISTFFGIMSANGVAVPLDVQMPSQQIRNIIFHSETKILITNQKNYNKVIELLEDVTIVLIDSTPYQDELKNISFDNNFIENKSKDDLAVLFYTSGTTGLPKGVMLTHFNLLSEISSLQERNLISSEDKVTALLPLHHAYAFTATLLMPVFVGASIVYPPGLTSIELITCLQKTQPSVFVGVPQIFSIIHRSTIEKLKSISLIKKYILTFAGGLSNILQKTFSINFNHLLFKEMHKKFGGNLRLMISGGAKLDQKVAQDFFRWGFILLEGYGLTETSPVVAFNPLTKPRVGSVGKPLADVNIVIKDVDKSGIGEVAIKGPNVMAGYYKMPKETAEVIQDDWFHTGDLGYFDPQGYLYLTGRKKEIIVLSSGKNINPEDVENHYVKSPFIKEIAVLSNQPSGHTQNTEHCVAIIVLDDETFKINQELSIHEKLKWELDTMSTQIPTYQHIHGFVISKKDLPRTRLGKLMRYKLPDLYEELSQNSSFMEKKEKEETVQKNNYSVFIKSALSFLEKSLGKPVAMSDHLELDLGIDSLGKIELFMGLQEKLNLDITEERMMDFFMCNTVQELANALKEINPSENIEQSIENKESSSKHWQHTLNELPSQETQNKICLNLNIFQKIFSFILICLLKLIFKIFFLLRVEGRHHLKAEGPYLICPNHTSYLDGLFILTALPFRIAFNTFFVGDVKFFKSFFVKPFIKLARLIPIELNYNLIEALKTSTFVLNKSKIVCYFPEGQRSIDGEIKEFKKGIGILIKELNIPVLPVYIDGAFKTWPRGQRFPRFSPIKVKFGQILPPKTIMSTNSKDNTYENIAKNLQNHVKFLA